MKKYLHTIFAVLGIAIIFFSCNNNNVVDIDNPNVGNASDTLNDSSAADTTPLMNSYLSWCVYLQVTNSDGSDFLQEISSADINSENEYLVNLTGNYDQYWVNGVDQAIYYDVTSYAFSSWFDIDKYIFSDEINSSNQVLPFALSVLLPSNIDSQYTNKCDAFLPEVLTFDVYCPMLFGDNDNHIISLNLEYPNGLAQEHIVTSAMLDEIELDVRTAQYDTEDSYGVKRTIASVLNYTLD
ncbi:MAG: hypothetical protein R3Y49_01810 [Rikenellaceae bacterium]